MMLQQICEILRTRYGHHELWLDWREWPSAEQESKLERQPVVISCSGCTLAGYDGTGERWSFIGTPEQRSLDNECVSFDLGRNKDNYLNDRSITALKEKFGF
ncbi:hypothetical protein EO763_23055 (plasmid) [Pectobacterium odoriferum]|uniref:hypothetical protein n=1 Tax=Pectobacterium odoriferum TaxID=78398 RepID=UPI00137465D9|nr:hypothetical protein [Pectobacterium odoriferum]QHP82775.1 hypothetical protein EO763_23055 [Pectobacterium odoriferum]